MAAMHFMEEVWIMFIIVLYSRMRKNMIQKNTPFLRVMSSYWGMPGGEALIAEISERFRLKI